MNIEQLHKQQHTHALCPRYWQTPTKRKPVMLLQNAFIDRAENKTVKYYQRWKILLPVGDHHQTNTSAPNAAVHMYMLKQTATTRLSARRWQSSTTCRSLLKPSALDTAAASRARMALWAACTRGASFMWAPALPGLPMPTPMAAGTPSVVRPLLGAESLMGRTP